MRLIDYPKPVDGSLYEETVVQVVDRLVASKCAHSIFQIGGVGHPGISDIDLFLVAHDDARLADDPLDMLVPKKRRLFTHSCLLVPYSGFPDLMRYTTFHNYTQLHGDTLDTNSDRSVKETRDLEGQIGIEFLVKNWIDLNTQLALKIIKVRAFLQHVKALRYDLQYLGMEGKPLHEFVTRTMEWIDDWFILQVSDSEFINCVRKLCALIEEAIADEIQSTPLLTAWPTEFRLSKNTLIRDGACRFRGIGIPIPPIAGMHEKRYFNLKSRFHRFTATVPLQDVAQNPFLTNRIDFFHNVKRFTCRQFPYFSAPVSPLFYYAS